MRPVLAKMIRWAAFGGLAALAVLWGVALLPARAPSAGTPPIGLPVRFDLVDSQGQAVSAASYHGRWLLLYFGYAYCPDICPTVLQTIGTVLDGLGPDAAKMSAAFVTIDPARDTPAALSQYVRLFDDRLIGLTGQSSQLAEFERLLQVRVLPAIAGHTADYSIQHSSSIYLVSPAGRLDTVFPTGTSAEVLQASIAARMANPEWRTQNGGQRGGEGDDGGQVAHR